MAHVGSQQRRKEVVLAAIAVLSRDGVAGATTRRIAEEAGAPLAALHYTFGEKDRLFAAVYEECCSRTESLLQELVDERIGLSAAIENTVMGFVEWVIREPEPQLAQFALLAWAVRTPEGRLMTASAFDRYFSVIESILAKAEPASAGTGIDRAQLARLVIMIIDGLQLQYLSSREPEPLRRDARAAIGALTSSLVVQSFH